MTKIQAARQEYTNWCRAIGLDSLDKVNDALQAGEGIELINLSDRLGFGAHSRLGVEDRLLAYFLTWSVAFGREEIIDEESWVTFPTPLRGTALQSVVSCSSAALERALGNLKQDGHYVTENEFARIRLSVLEPIHKWIRNNEEKSSVLHRDRLQSILSSTQPQ